MRGGAKIGFTVHIGPDVQASKFPRSLESIGEPKHQAGLSPPTSPATPTHRYAASCRLRRTSRRCF